MLYDVLFQSNLQHGLFFLAEGKKIDGIIPYNPRGSQTVTPHKSKQPALKITPE